MGNTFVHDDADAALAGAAAAGNRDAFGLLFERHLRAVFDSAWHVLHDREVAAEIARDTFAAAWRHIDAVPPEAFAESLLDSAHHKAGVWLEANPQAAATAAAPPTGGPPNVGPVLRARVVTALEVQGIPTKVKVQEHVEGLVDFGPPSLRSRLRTRAAGLRDKQRPDPAGTGRRARPAAAAASPPRPGLAERLAGVGGRLRAAVAGLFASTRGRLGAAAVAVVVLGISGVVAMGGDTGTPDGGGDAVETAARRDDEPGRPSGEDSEDGDDAEPGSPSSTGSTTTSTTAPGATTTSTGPADDEQPDPMTPRPVAAPPTTAATAPATPTPRPTTTRAAPPAPARPAILWFDGHFYADDRGTCPSGHERLSMWWGTTGGQWIWIHTEGAVWQDVSWGMPNGNTEVCTPLGTKWYFEIRNSAGEATRTLQRSDFTY